MLSICAVIAARNEAQYLRILLPLLACQNIDVVVLDNESTDESPRIYSEYLHDPIIRVERLPYRGYFSLTEQLLAKRRVYGELRHDWVIHHDADEVMEHLEPGRTLRDAIEETNERGYTALNFDEFTFLPEPGSDHRGMNYYIDITRYYFFEPWTNRLNRAWKRAAGLDLVESAGHRLYGDQLALSPNNGALRHYIVLGYEHAKQKYIHRSFDTQDTAREWHISRRGFTEANLVLPRASRFLFNLQTSGSKEFRRDFPSQKHYWEWT